MNMKTRKNYLLLLCINLYWVRCLEGADDSSIRIPKMFNHFLTGFTFQTFSGISWIQCIKMCQALRKCKSINYANRLGLCDLNDADETANQDNLQRKDFVIYSSESSWNFEEPEHCLTCSDGEMCVSDVDDSCVVHGCLPSYQVADATILGNKYHIGSKRLYRCVNGVKETSVCQEDGTWSPVTIVCTCLPLEIENAVYEITETDNGVTEATITCDPGFFHRGVNKTQCNPDTLHWDNLDQIGCIRIYAEPWTKIYRTIDGFSKDIYKSWTEGKTLKTGEFRHEEVLENWSSKGIQQIKVDVIDFSDNIVNTLVFDGTNTQNKNWFHYNKLISSSFWQLSDTPNTFSVSGVSCNITEDSRINLRWAILDVETDSDNNKLITCSNRLWFTIYHTGGLGPLCGNTWEGSGQKLIYSTSAAGTTWNGGQLEVAKEMLISVLMA